MLHARRGRQSPRARNDRAASTWRRCSRRPASSTSSDALPTSLASTTSARSCATIRSSPSDVVEFAGPAVCSRSRATERRGGAPCRDAVADVDIDAVACAADDRRRAWPRESYVLPPVHVTRGDAGSAIAARTAPAAAEPVRVRRPGSLLSRRADRARACRASAAACMYLHVDAASGRSPAHGRARARHRSTTTSSSNAGEWAAASAARRRRCRCSRASPRCSRARPARAVKLRLDRDDDMRSTGKRHAFQYDYDVGFDDDGRILGARHHARVALRLLGGSVGAGQRPRRVPRRQLPTGCPTSRSTAYRCKTHTVSDTAFRGFGGPQGMFAIEMVDRRDRARPAAAIRSTCASANLYGKTERNRRALRHDGRGQHRARADRPTSKHALDATARGARRSRAWNRRQSGRSSAASR